MVWESGCAVIVMLTPLSENGVRQCHHYWPDEGSNLYHVYEVLGLGAHTGPGQEARISSSHQQPNQLLCGAQTSPGNPQVELLAHLTSEGSRCCTAHEDPMPYLLHR